MPRLTPRTRNHENPHHPRRAVPARSRLHHAAARQRHASPTRTAGSRSIRTAASKSSSNPAPPSKPWPSTTRSPTGQHRHAQSSATVKAREWLHKCLEARHQREDDQRHPHLSRNKRCLCSSRGRTTAGPKSNQCRVPVPTVAPTTSAWAGISWCSHAKGQPQWESPLMASCGRIAESLGLEWGGSWKGSRTPRTSSSRPALSTSHARQQRHVEDGNLIEPTMARGLFITGFTVSRGARHPARGRRNCCWKARRS